MGCGVSKSQPGEEVPPGLRPFWRRMQELKRSRMEELRRRRRERKDSIVSTSELLQHEERWGEECRAAEANSKEDELNRKAAETENATETEKAAVTEKAAEQEKAAETDKVATEEDARKIGFGREPAAAAEQELPGSPSFRFYFSDAVKATQTTRFLEFKGKEWDN